MSRPQTVEAIQTPKTNPLTKEVFRQLSLKGISTNLKANDPLLIDFGIGATPKLFRVLEVNADAAADRTLVKMNPWIENAKAVGRIATLRETIVRLTDAASPQAAHRAIKLAVESFGSLQRQIDGGATEAELAKSITDDILPSLANEAKVLSPLATVIGPLLTGIMTELGDAASSLAGADPDQARHATGALVPAMRIEALRIRDRA